MPFAVRLLAMPPATRPINNKNLLISYCCLCPFASLAVCQCVSYRKVARFLPFRYSFIFLLLVFYLFFFFGNIIYLLANQIVEGAHSTIRNEMLVVNWQINEHLMAS